MAAAARKGADGNARDADIPLSAIARALSAGIAAIVAIVGAVIGAGGCSASRTASYPPVAYGSPQPVQHIVRPGETVYHIARAYHVSVRSLIDANHLSDSRDLRVGQSLLIPGAY